MKRLSNLLAALVFASLVIFMSCGGGGGDDGPSDLEVAVTNLTAGTFSNPTTVTTNNGTADGDWSSFSITFEGNTEGGSYSVGNTVPDGFSDVWSNGTWTINNNGTVITKTQGGEDTDITVQIDENFLSMSFNVDTQSGRVSGIDGSWTFVFE